MVLAADPSKVVPAAAPPEVLKVTAFATLLAVVAVVAVVALPTDKVL